PDELRSEPAGSLPAGRELRRQNSRRGQAGRPAGGAAHEVRFGDQPQDREGVRAPDSASTTATRGRVNPVMERSGPSRLSRHSTTTIGSLDPLSGCFGGVQPSAEGRRKPTITNVPPNSSFNWTCRHQCSTWPTSVHPRRLTW